MRTLQLLKRFFTLSVLILLTQNAFGWGATGHRVVGQVAEEHLDRKTRKAIEKILGHESLAIASTWADEIKSDRQYNYAKPWHYINVPEGESFDEADRSETDILKAIKEMSEQLTDPESSMEEKRFALRFLVHLIGDLHQPLHAGHRKDLGGNRVDMEWFDQETNLHSVWDSKMIDFTKLSYTELAESIDRADKTQVRQWQNSDVNDWLKEALVMREEIYNSADEDLYAYRYAYLYYPVVEDQLEKAGVRLAGLLNELLG